MRPSVLAILALTSCATVDASFTAATFNAGLAVGFVPAANERAPVVADALAGVQADVICLQEVWEPQHVTAIEQATADAFPHSYFPEAAQVIGEEPGCADGEIDGLLACMEANCADVCADDLPDCLLSSCPLQFATLPKDCMRCTQANVGATPAEIGATCESELTEYAYGGSFGTGILSKHPILSTEELVFESTTNRRSLLHAVVDLPGGEADVYCTHLTAIFAVVPYPREEGTWAEEQKTQVEELVDWIDETATHDTVVLMGDMNNGPTVGQSQAEYPEHYALFDALGMDNAYVDDDGDCTFCNDNLLASVDSDAEQRVIDHVFVKGHTELAASRILDAQIETESCGEPIDGNYSDHYGVAVDVTRE